MAKLDLDELSRDLVERTNVEVDTKAMAKIVVKKSLPGILQKVHVETGVICKNCRYWVYRDCGPVCICKFIMRPVYNFNNFTKNDEGYCSYFEWGENE